MHKDVTEQNAGLAAQNALLKKQLAYFEDIFAKSSLLGFDPNNSSAVNKSDLEEFQKNLLKKINKRLFQESLGEEDQNDSNPLDESLGILPHKRARNILDDRDSISTTSISAPIQQSLQADSNEDRVESLRLVRSRSNSSNSFSRSGYLFLAVVFCMMCCSSLLVSPSQNEVFTQIINAG